MTLVMLTDRKPQRSHFPVSHNLLGQRLGRKGQETRERILTAALRLLEARDDVPVTLTSVAREASVGMTTLYLYFPDLGDLVLAALRRVMDTADVAFVDRLRARWPDETLETCCLDFLRAHHKFWQEHARILHMRNSLADASDLRFLEYRYQVSRPLIDLLVAQMGSAEVVTEGDEFLATVLLTGFERTATVVTNPVFHTMAQVNELRDEARYIDGLIAAEARLMALAIGASREKTGSACGSRAALHTTRDGA